MKKICLIAGLMAAGIGWVGSLHAQEITSAGTIKVGGAPRGIAVTTDGLKCYVPDINTGDIHVIDTVTATVRKILNIGGGRGARNPVMSPDGKFVVILAPPDAVAIIDTSSDAIVSRIYIPIPPANIVFTGDGSTMLMYILTSGSYNYLTKVDMTTFSVTSQIEMPKTILFNGFVVTRDGRYALATTAWSDDPLDYLTVVEIATMQVVAKVAVGMLPVSVALSADGAKAYVANYNSSSVTVVDLAGLAVMREIILPGKPYRARTAASGKSVWAVCDNQDVLAVVDAATDALAGTVSSPGIATPKNDIVFRADKRLAVSTASDTGMIHLLDVSSMTIVKSVGSGGRVTDLVMTAKGDYVYAVDELNGAVVAASVTGSVLNLADTIAVVIEAINGLMANASGAQKKILKEALEKLVGKRDGKAGNGALDKLNGGEFVAAMVKIKQSIRELEEAGRTGIDTTEMQRLLAEASARETERLISQAEASGVTWATTQARMSLSLGLDALSAGNYSGAIDRFKKAVDILQ